MKLVKKLSSIWKSESGAITVDWTVMTAAVIALGFAVTLPIATGAGKMGASIGGALGSENVELAANEALLAENETTDDTQF